MSPTQIDLSPEAMECLAAGVDPSNEAVDLPSRMHIAKILRAASVELERLRKNTTRFPDHMARIVAEKDMPLDPRIERLISAMKKLPEYIHQYQWVADECQLFGDKWVRAVAGDNGQGMGRQAIAECPNHIDGLAEYIAAANPDTIAMLIAALVDDSQPALDRHERALPTADAHQSALIAAERPGRRADA